MPSRIAPHPGAVEGRATASRARAADRRDTGTVSQHEIDAYLAALDEPKRSTLEVLRKTILEVVRDADQGLAYGVPAFRVSGKTVA